MFSIEKILELNKEKYFMYFSGSILEKDINLIFKPKEKKFSKKAEDFIKKLWIETKAKYPNIYDGDIVDLISVEKQNDKLNIYYDYTKYSYTIASRNNEYRKFENDGNYTSNHVSIPTLIRTTDNKIPIGSDLSIKNSVRTWKFPGGYWEKSANTIFDNVKKECIEEIGNIKLLNPQVIGIAKYNNRSSISVLVDTPISSNELFNFIKNNNAVDSHEMAEVKFIDFDKNTINNFLNENSINLGSMTIITLYNAMQFLNCKNN